NEKLDTLRSYFPEMEKALKRKGITREYLWQQYISDHPDGYRVSMFKEHYNRWRKQSVGTMHIEHKAGDKIYIDFAGSKLSVDPQEGTARDVEVFVAILGCSQLTYAEAVESQRKEDLIKACENALHYFGGIPQAIVPDNLRSAVTKGSKYEAVLNDEFACFAEHYGV
ncbi:MAG: transposase, partial [Bacteroides sp.]|nr:transposase [Bacteroides sp.]